VSDYTQHLISKNLEAYDKAYAEDNPYARGSRSAHGARPRRLRCALLRAGRQPRRGSRARSPSGAATLPRACPPHRGP
jgi:hypothetical protein